MAANIRFLLRNKVLVNDKSARLDTNLHIALGMKNVVTWHKSNPLVQAYFEPYFAATLLHPSSLDFTNAPKNAEAIAKYLFCLRICFLMLELVGKKTDAIVASAQALIQVLQPKLESLSEAEMAKKDSELIECLWYCTQNYNKADMIFDDKADMIFDDIEGLMHWLIDMGLNFNTPYPNRPLFMAVVSDLPRFAKCLGAEKILKFLKALLRHGPNLIGFDINGGIGTAGNVFHYLKSDPENFPERDQDYPSKQACADLLQAQYNFQLMFFGKENLHILQQKMIANGNMPLAAELNNVLSSLDEIAQEMIQARMKELRVAQDTMSLLQPCFPQQNYAIPNIIIEYLKEESYPGSSPLQPGMAEKFDKQFLPHRLVSNSNSRVQRLTHHYDRISDAAAKTQSSALDKGKLVKSPSSASSMSASSAIKRKHQKEEVEQQGREPTTIPSGRSQDFLKLFRQHEKISGGNSKEPVKANLPSAATRSSANTEGMG